MSVYVSPLYAAVWDRGLAPRPMGAYMTAGSKAELLAFLALLGLPQSRFGVNQWERAIAGLHSFEERQKALDLGAAPKEWDAYNQLAMSV